MHGVKPEVVFTKKTNCLKQEGKHEEEFRLVLQQNNLFPDVVLGGGYEPSYLGLHIGHREEALSLLHLHFWFICRLQIIFKHSMTLG
jgi:hypothetical protein